VLNDGVKIAVKVLHDMPGFEEEQFLKEFNNLAKLQHPNIVRLVGYCYEIQKQYVEHKGRLVLAERFYRALCFEYMHHGSLDKYLSGIMECYLYHHLANYGTILQIYLYENVLFICCYR
jgi:interleukin-1 receptor-associated kinase 1/coatomer subunit beta'